MKSQKIFNDPVYGFITIQDPLILQIIDHQYFQKLRRIKQLGLSSLVYPGATHSRFHHTLGALHLVGRAVQSIRNKGHEISEDEERGVKLAILLHDIGHGPYSHALEHTLVQNVHHEELSLLFMHKLNEEYTNQLSLSIQIFTDQYHKKFLHQLVSNQLDMDRLDFLNRDSFYSGVSEGVVGTDRIIDMLTVKDGQLLIEQKGIYSIEKFLVARRLMYWQVYLHKTVVAAEFLLIFILKRAKSLSQNGTKLFASPQLNRFLVNEFSKEDFESSPELLESFSELDDFDIMGAIKVWTKSDDKLLSLLCSSLLHRKLLKIEISETPFSESRMNSLKEKVQEKYQFDSLKDSDHLVFTNLLVNNAYNIDAENIRILSKLGDVQDIAKASDNLNISALSKPVQKYFLCYPKFLA